MKKLTVADWVSLYRIVAVPFIGFALVRGSEDWFKYLLALSLFSDLIDGIIARLLKQISALGSKLDSVGDLLTQLVMVAGLFRFRMEVLETYNVWFLSVAGLYLLQVIYALAKYRQMTSFHTYLSKAAFLFLGIFVLILFFYGFVNWLFYLAMLVSMLSLGEELLLIKLLSRPKENVKGYWWVWKN